MARDKVTYESYEQDVFDNPPKGPVASTAVPVRLFRVSHRSSS